MKHVTTRLVCKHCGVTGAATWDHAQFRRQRDLLEFSAGFKSIDRDRVRHHFRCQACGRKVEIVDAGKISKAA